MWYGWVKRNATAPWVKVAEASSIQEAHRQLLREAERRRIRVSRWRALTSGGQPPWTTESRQ
jgi:hypothetical protein